MDTSTDDAEASRGHREGHENPRTGRFAVKRVPHAGASRSAPSPMKNMVRSLLADVGLPVAAYFAFELLGASAYASLLAGTVAAALRTAWVGLRERRLDVFATFLLVMFGVGFVLTFVTGDVRFVLAKDATTSATAGLVFLGSCLTNRPLAYYAAKRFAGSAGNAEFVASQDTPLMRKRWYSASLVWGVGLLTDATLRVACIYLLSPDVAANASQVLMIAAYTMLISWTIRSATRTKMPDSVVSRFDSTSAQPLATGHDRASSTPY